jgi:hypothetical protein
LANRLTGQTNQHNRYLISVRPAAGSLVMRCRNGARRTYSSRAYRTISASSSSAICSRRGAAGSPAIAMARRRARAACSSKISAASHVTGGGWVITHQRRLADEGSSEAALLAGHGSAAICPNAIVVVVDRSSPRHAARNGARRPMDFRPARPPAASKLHLVNSRYHYGRTPPSPGIERQAWPSLSLRRICPGLLDHCRSLAAAILAA